MLVEHPLLDLVGGAFERDVCLDLYESAAYHPPHEMLLSACRAIAREASGGTCRAEARRAEQTQTCRAIARDGKRRRNLHIFSALKLCQETYYPRFRTHHIPEEPWLPSCRSSLPG